MKISSHVPSRECEDLLVSNSSLGSFLRRGRRAASQPRRTARKLTERVLQHGTYWLGDGRSAPPAAITLFLTTRCNLRCKMCDLWGESGLKRAEVTSSSRATEAEFPLDAVRSLAKEVASFNPTVTLFGGEPLLHRDIVPFIECLKEHKVRTAIITNGVLLPHYYRELVDLEVDEITVSIDGPAPIHDAVRGVSGTYDKAVSGIDAVGEYKQKVGRRTPLVKVLCTISDLNFQYLDSLVAGLEGRCLDRISFQHVMFVSKELLRRHNSFFQRAFGLTSNCLEGFLRDVSTKIDMDELGRQITKVKARNHGVPVEFFTDFTLDEVRRYYTDFNFSYKSRCFAPWKEVLILPDGTVSPCLDFVAGNVKEEPFLSIWNGPRFVEFRRKLKQIGKFPICDRCCLLYRN